MTRYLTLEMFQKEGFPYIQSELTAVEPAPAYEADAQGMAELKKVLDFSAQDYYPSFEEKAAYLITSIAASQYFSNGNKRLAVVTLLMFLTINDVGVVVDSPMVFERLLKVIFPKCEWEENGNIKEAHALFLYNLAIVLGDRPKWEKEDFADTRERVSRLFKYIYRRGP
jgi:prophage maintenance system killer protein